MLSPATSSTTKSPGCGMSDVCAMKVHCRAEDPLGLAGEDLVRDVVAPVEEREIGELIERHR